MADHDAGHRNTSSSNNNNTISRTVHCNNSSAAAASTSMSRLSHVKSLPAPLFIASESGTEGEAAQGNAAARPAVTSAPDRRLSPHVTSRAPRAAGGAGGDSSHGGKVKRSYRLSPNLCAATSALTAIATSPDEEQQFMQPARLRQLCAAGGCTPLFRAHHYDVNGENNGIGGGSSNTRTEAARRQTSAFAAAAAPLSATTTTTTTTTAAAAASCEEGAAALTSVTCRNYNQTGMSMPRSFRLFQSPTLSGMSVVQAQQQQQPPPQHASSAQLTCEGSVLSVSTPAVLPVPSGAKGCDTPAQAALTPPSPALSPNSSFALPFDLGECVLATYPERWQDVVAAAAAADDDDEGNDGLASSDDDDEDDDEYDIEEEYDEEARSSPLSIRLSNCHTTPMLTTGWAAQQQQQQSAPQLWAVQSPSERRISSTQTQSLPASSVPSCVSTLITLGRTPREEVQLEMSKLHAIAASRAIAAAAAAAAAQGSVRSCYLGPRSASTPRRSMASNAAVEEDKLPQEEEEEEEADGDDDVQEASSMWSDDEAAAPDARLNHTLPPPQPAANASPFSQDSMRPALSHTVAHRPTPHDSSTPLMPDEERCGSTVARQRLRSIFCEEADAVVGAEADAARDSLCPLHELLDLVEVVEVFQLRAGKARREEVPLGLQMTMLAALHRVLRLQQLLLAVQHEVNTGGSNDAVTECGADGCDAAAEDAAARRRASEELAHTLRSMLQRALPAVWRNIRVARRVLRCKQVTLRWADEILCTAMQTIEHGMAGTAAEDEMKHCHSRQSQPRLSTISSCCDTPGLNASPGPFSSGGSPAELPERRCTASDEPPALPEMLHQLEVEMYHELGVHFAQFVAQCRRRMVRLALLRAVLDMARTNNNNNNNDNTGTRCDGRASSPFVTAGADEDSEASTLAQLQTCMEEAMMQFGQNVQQQQQARGDVHGRQHDVRLAFHDLPDLTEVALRFSFMRHSSSWAWWYRLYAETHPTRGRRVACEAALCAQARSFCRNDERGRSLVHRVQHDAACAEVLQGNLAAARDDVRRATAEYDHAVHHILRHILQRLCLVRGCWCVDMQDRIGCLAWLREQHRSVQHALRTLKATTGLRVLHELREMLQSVHARGGSVAARRSDHAANDHGEEAEEKGQDEQQQQHNAVCDEADNTTEAASRVMIFAPQATSVSEAEMALWRGSCKMPTMERQAALEHVMQVLLSVTWQLCRLLPCATQGETGLCDKRAVASGEWRQPTCPRSMRRLHTSLDELMQSLQSCLCALQTPEGCQCRVDV